MAIRLLGVHAMPFSSGRMQKECSALMDMALAGMTSLPTGNSVTLFCDIVGK
jgi:hypothetical protein